MKGALVCKHLTRVSTTYKRRYFSSSKLVRNSNDARYDNEPKTHFGFKTVPETEKEEKVYKVFENVADKYDVMNDAMSGGVHRLWKDYFIERFGPTPGTKLIDVAGGTGDIAFRFLQSIQNTELEDEADTQFNFEQNINMFSEGNADDADGNLSQKLPRESHVTVCDINQAMLNVGKQRAKSLGFRHGLSWLKGNAECLPVSDGTYDAYTIAFGIRNTTHIEKVLSEAHRVLKTGGRFLCLEFSEVNNSVLKRFYDEYSFQVIPVMGHVIAGDWDSYQYLVESIRKFPDQRTFAKMIQTAGFRAVHYENLMFGVAAIHSGFKL